MECFIDSGLFIKTKSNQHIKYKQQTDTGLASCPRTGLVVLSVQ